jgi:hypothetical protein
MDSFEAPFNFNWLTQPLTAAQREELLAVAGASIHSESWVGADVDLGHGAAVGK